MIGSDCYFLLCFGPAAPAPPERIFGFSDFLAAAALLIVFYQIIDFRYRFRLAILPKAFSKAIFFIVSFVGAGTLTMEISLCSRMVDALDSASDTCTLAGNLCGVVPFWRFSFSTYQAFISPSTFNRLTAQRYTLAVYGIMVKGNDSRIGSPC